MQLRTVVDVGRNWKLNLEVISPKDEQKVLCLQTFWPGFRSAIHNMYQIKERFRDSVFSGYSYQEKDILVIEKEFTTVRLFTVQAAATHPVECSFSEL